MAKSYFAILEVTSDATPDEVHSAYRRLAKVYHPDHYGGGSEPFQQIQEAYSVLANPAERKAYEKSLSSIQVRKVPDITPYSAPEPLIPEEASFAMGDISSAFSSKTRQRAHSSPIAAGLASQRKIDVHPYGEDSPWLAAGGFNRFRAPLKRYSIGYGTFNQRRCLLT